MTRFPTQLIGRVRLCFAVAVLAMLGSLQPQPARAQAVCAEVKIEIQQKLNIERQGFIATMKINNGLETTTLTNIGVNVKFADRNGVAVRATSNPNDTSALFFIREDFISDITGGVQGGGSVAPKTTGEARWLIIPAQGAGGTTAAGEIYAIGATLTYKEGTETRTVEVTPEIITVRPQPALELDYFLAREVYADDPFTEVVEPAVPFTLGVRVKNSGAGPANRVSIESAQPRIVENNQGLLIGFQIDGSYVQDQPTQNTMLIDFGNIEPGRAKAGRWVMSTTLSGRFTEFGAEFTHADALGGAVTSLLERVTTHTLLKDVRVDLPGRDQVRDFLALDGDIVRVYETDGADTEVADVSQNAILTAAGPAYDLVFNAVPTAQFVKLVDPSNGRFEIGRVERSDGKILPAENAWLSKERTESGSSWRYYVNLFDIAGTGRYRLHAANPVALSSLTGDVYVDANRNGQRDETEQGIAGVVVTLDGSDVHGAAVHELLASDAAGAYRFDDVVAGNYALLIGNVADMDNGTHVAGSAGGTAAADRIDGLVIAAGSQVTGYRFAKLPIAPPASADIAVELSLSDAEIDVGHATTATIRVTNLGPDATSATVAWQLPPGLNSELANASAGVVDAAAALWTLDALASGESATLNLELRAAVAGNGELRVTSTGAAVDPDAANNNAATTITVSDAPVETPSVMQELNRLPRVLALVTCSNATGIDPVCTNARAGRLSSLLSRIGLDHAVVTSTMSYREALRSGRYNVHWISGGSALMIEQIADELRVAMRRGDGLLVDGIHSGQSSVLDRFFGVTYVGPIAAAPGALTTTDGVFAEGTALTGQGTHYALDSATATVEARYASGDEAILSAQNGDGRALFFALELIDSAMQPSATATWDQVVETALIWLSGQAGQLQVGRDYIPVSTRISNPTAEAVSVRVEMTLDTGLSLATTATPLDPSSSPGAPRWTVSVPAGSQRWIDLGLRAPTQSGAIGLRTKAMWLRESTTEPLFDETLSVQVDGAVARFTAVLATLRAMTLTDPLQISQRDSIVASLELARARLNDGQPASAITALLAAETAASALATTQPSVPLKELSLLVEEASLRWQGLNPTCGAAELAGMTVDASTFWPIALNERLEIQGGRAGNSDWEWAVGTNTNSQQHRADFAAFNWISGRSYQWSLTYAANGSAQMSVRDHGGVLFTKTFTPRQAPGMRSGSAVRVSATLNGSVPDTPILVTLDRVGGAPASAVLQAGTGTQRDRSTAVYFPAMASGLRVEGSIQLNFVGSTPPDRAKLNVQVHAGDVACRPELAP